MIAISSTQIDINQYCSFRNVGVSMERETVCENTRSKQLIIHFDLFSNSVEIQMEV